MRFIEWLIKEESAVRSYKKANPKNPEQNFIVLYGNTYSIKDELKKMGFRYFQGTWSVPDSKFTDQLKDQLIKLGVDLSGIEEAEKSPHPANPVQQQSQQEPTNKTDQLLQQMQHSLDMAIKSETQDSKLKNLVANIEKMIEHVANSTDEAAKQELLTNFLKFSSKFHNYSMANQMLIWAQTGGKADHVSSASNWVKLGRSVKDWSKGILIYAPITKKITTEPSNKDVPEVEPKKQYVTRFKSVKVYDISATEPIPGHPSPFQPLSRKDWSKDSNEDIEELNVLINSLTNWIKEKNINVNYKELSDEHGGYSAGGEIAINNKFKGINLFSTLVHETAHEILHWLEEKSKSKSELGSQSSRKQKEIDAETTAYIVCHHFGFETKDTPNYLALWQAKGDEIRERKQNIHKASKLIIQGIQQKVTDMELNFDQEQEIESENKVYKFTNLLENLCLKIKNKFA